MKNGKSQIVSPDVTWQNITPGGTIYDAGNAELFNTGDWRIMKPVFIEKQCKQCLLCVPVCPDSSIPVKDGKRQGFDYKHCKGCGICAKICRQQAIDLVVEG